MIGTKEITMPRIGFLISVTILLLFCGCEKTASNSAEKENAGAASKGLPRVAADAAGLQRKNGLLYMNGDLFSGEVAEYYAEGSVKSITPYLKGKQDGTARGWYPDGMLMFQRPYDAGKRQGIHRSWWENGIAQSVFHFQDDLHEGSGVEWFPNGMLYREFHYKGGQESGQQRMWNQDGTARANYVVVNGRRYGSMGSKPCISNGTDTGRSGHNG